MNAKQGINAEYMGVAATTENLQRNWEFSEMVLLQHHCYSCSSLSFSDNRTRQFGRFVGSSKQRTNRRDWVRVAAALRLEDFAEIAHNKVLIAAAGSAAIGQIFKPLTSTLFYGKDFDLRTALQAGGFPSTHSSSVVAAATIIALERGFSDSIFGITVVYAGLIMYDAQGVRREVGIHAKALNNVISKTRITPTPFKGQDKLIDSLPKTPSAVTMKSRSSSISGEESSSFASEPNNTPSLRSGKETSQTTQMSIPPLGTDKIEEVTERVTDLTLLKESIGHTEVEVIAGGLLGFCVSLLVYMIM